MFSVSFCLYKACFTHLISSNLSCNLCLWYYDQLVHFNKEINANVYRHSLCSILNVSTVHLNGIFTPHMTLSLETCIRGRPCIKRTLQHSPRVSALIQVSLYILWSDKMELRTRVTCLNVKLRQLKYGIQTVNLRSGVFFDRRL